MKTIALVFIFGLSRFLVAASATPVTTANPATTATNGPQAAEAQPEPPPSPCRVQARNEHTQTGGSCPVGELMTGIEKVSPLTLHCAAIDVRCDAPTRFLASEPPPAQTAVPATPEKNVELLPPPPADDKNN